MINYEKAQAGLKAIKEAIMAELKLCISGACQTLIPFTSSGSNHISRGRIEIIFHGPY